jgi:hypothetical protein
MIPIGGTKPPWILADTVVRLFILGDGGLKLGIGVATGGSIGSMRSVPSRGRPIARPNRRLRHP